MDSVLDIGSSYIYNHSNSIVMAQSKARIRRRVKQYKRKREHINAVCRVLDLYAAMRVQRLHEQAGERAREFPSGGMTIVSSGTASRKIYQLMDMVTKTKQ